MIKTKFQIPIKNNKIIAKPELEHILDDTTVSCIIIKAMPGFGKTAVLTEIAGKRRDSVRWYNLDVTDNNGVCFLSCLEHIWETVDKEICDTATDEDDAQQRLMALVQRTQRWQTGIHLILDNFQMLASESVRQQLLLLQQYTEGKITFVLLTSKEVPKGFLPLLLKGKGKLLSEDVLRLTSDEVWKNWGETAGLSREEVSQITGDLCGWPLGIRCVLEYLGASDCTCEMDQPDREQRNRKGNFPDWNRIFRESLLSGYLDEILWDSCSGEMQAFLGQTAVLGRFSWEMCHEVLEVSFPYQSFEEIVSCHGILARVPGREGYYQYGKAFENYLSCKLSDGEKTRIYYQAALWCRKKGDFMGLATYGVSGGQDRFLLLTMEQYGAELLCERNQSALGIMIAYLEQNAVLLLPEAAGIMAQFFYSQGNYNKMEGYLNIADSSFGKENKYAGYRSLYRGLLKLEKDREKYEKQIHNALFFLKESQANLPYLREPEKEKLKELMEREEDRTRQALQVNTLGTFQVTALQDGKELAWRTKKGRELFAYLLDLEGKAVERRKLIEMLWQDEIPDHAVAMLHNMIYHIRKELSAYRLERILTYENKKYRLSTEEIVCDFWHIQKIAGLVKAKDSRNLRMEYRSFLRYWGTYLEDIDSSWAEEKRGYYDEIFKQGCWLLGEQFAGEQDYETALALYGNILSLDPYSETAVEKMLLLYGKQKRWEKVKQCYYNFKNILEKDLGIAPGEEVLAAYHTYL